jgi:hypothetical protein
MNWVGPDRPSANFFPGRKAEKEIREKAEGIPAMEISSLDGFADSVRANPSDDATVTLTPQEPSWGYLRVFEETAGQDIDGDGVLEYEQVGTFSDVPHVHEFPPPKGFGAWSIHNTEVSGDRAYVSWYSNGIVALDLTDPTTPELVGQFVPGNEVGEAAMWAVAIDHTTGLVYGSDIESGLWILEPTGPAIPGAP